MLTLGEEALDSGSVGIGLCRVDRGTGWWQSERAVPVFARPMLAAMGISAPGRLFPGCPGVGATGADTDLAGKILDWLSGDRRGGRTRRGYVLRAGDLKIPCRPVPPELLSRFSKKNRN